MFRQKLFRLFLLFSLLPAIILIIAGYYVASQENPATGRSYPEHTAMLADYYNEYLFTVIDNACRACREESANLQITPLDFIVQLEDMACRSEGSKSAISPEAVTKIAEAAKTRPRGFVRIDTLYYQYSVTVDTSSGTFVGGLIHDRTYTELAGIIQTDLSTISSHRALTSDYLLFLAFLFLALAVITAALAYFFSARFSRNLAYPLARLSEASRAIARGDFDQKVDVDGIGEIKTLIENFNHMAGQLRVTTSRLAQSERVAAWRNLARRFAHELKNPLQPVLVAVFRLEKILKDTPHYESVKQPLQAAAEELKHLTELADRFSQLAKLPEPKLRPTNLNELLASVADLWTAKLSEFDFRLALPPQTVTANIDDTYFREVIHNLLQNAMEASSAGEQICISLSVENSTARLTVEDSGVGMDENTALAARLPYFSTKTGGSGIGLAVVDKIISELGGNVLIDSIPGEGTKITVSIPVSADYD